MSAIDTTFHFVRNPTAINGLATTYVSQRGNDTAGDGTAQNPYASIAKATSVATENTNIMLDDGEWSQQRTLNNRAFKWWGNGRTEINSKTVNLSMYGDEEFYFLHIKLSTIAIPVSKYFKLFYSIIENVETFNTYSYNTDIFFAKNSIILNCNMLGYYNSVNCQLENSLVIGGNTAFSPKLSPQFYIKNCIFTGTINAANHYGVNCDYNNYTTLAIPTTNGANAHSINNASTGQTVADYFNKYDANDWLKCDFTAKEGSKNIGAGDKGTTIGLNKGYTMYADNSANDMFSPSNGATLKNIAWDSNLNGYTLVQKERICQGATATTITLDSDASAVDDYYNNLFIGIVVGDGYGELFLITDYDGATKTVTIDGTWATIPTANSIYTISGTILSAVKDLGKAIKVKRNWTFADNFTALADGQWAEFMTHVGTNGKQFPTSCYSYEYSTDGVNFVQGQTADDLVSATNGDNKVTDNIYGDCSQNYNVATAKNLIMRYIRVRVHIGFNIGQLGE